MTLDIMSICFLMYRATMLYLPVDTSGKGFFACSPAPTAMV
jgi:hypothetical protein